MLMVGNSIWLFCFSSWLVTLYGWSTPDGWHLLMVSLLMNVVLLVQVNGWSTADGW